MQPRPRLTAGQFFLACCCLPLALSVSLFAQASPAETTTGDSLHNLLQHLQDNVIRFRTAVPSFFCDEHVVSGMTQWRQSDRHTITESIFRLKRSVTDTTPPHLRLDESRQIKKIDNQPAEGQQLHGPAVFVGAFSNALTTVTLANESCYEYSLIPGQRLHRIPALVIGYTLKASAVDDQACPGPEPHSGRAFIDPHTLQVIRLEMRTPNHAANSDHGPWTWSIDYAPVLLDNKQFWMPATIRSYAEGFELRESWSFVATYRNYHKEGTYARILPGSDYNP